MIAPILMAVALATAGTAGITWAYHQASKYERLLTEQRNAHLEQIATQAQATTELLKKARAAQDALTKQIEATQTKARHEVRRIRSEHDALVDSLRNRPDARAGDSGVPEGASAGVGCTGAGLSRSDALFLGGYAAAAARTQAALQQCVDAYNQVREASNGRD